MIGFTLRRRTIALASASIVALVPAMSFAPTASAQTTPAVKAPEQTNSASAPGSAAPQSSPVIDQQAPSSTATGSAPVDPKGLSDTAQDANDRDKDIVVTGFRAAVGDALDQKRNAIEFSDTVSTEGLDRFPDLNVGEALTRLPGIQLNRDQADRAASVNIRGLPSNFSRITLNGQSLADPSFGGAVPLGSFNTDIFTAFTVIKSPLAETPAGGLSGIIDLRIADALKRKEGGSARISVEYDDLGKRKSPSANINYTKKFGDDFAVYGSFSYKKEDFRRDTFATLFSSISPTTNPLFDPRTRNNGQANNLVATTGPQGTANAFPFTQFLDYYGPTTTPNSTTGTTCVTQAPTGAVPNLCIQGGTGAKGTKGVYYPGRFDLMSNDTKGNLYSGAAGAEWRVAPDLKLGATGFLTIRDLDKNRNSGLRVENRFSPTLVQPDVSGLYVAPDGRAYLDKYTGIDTTLLTLERNRKSFYSTGGGTFSVDWTPEHWRFSTNASHTQGTSKFFETNFGFVTNAAGLFVAGGANANTVGGPTGDGINSTFDLAGGDVHNVGFSFAGTQPFFGLIPRQPTVMPGVESSPTPFVYSNCSTFFDDGVPLRPTATSNPFNAQCGSIIDAKNNQLQIVTTIQRTTSKVTTIGQDVERDIFHPIVKSIQFGARFERTDFTSFAEAGVPLGILALPNVNSLLTSPDLFKPAAFASSFFGGNLAFPNAPVINSEYILANLKPNPANLLANNFNTNTGPQRLAEDGFVEDATSADKAGRNFTVRTDVYAAYAETKLDTDVLGMKFRANLGLRFEKTKEHYTTLERQIIPPTVGPNVAVQPAVGSQTVGAPYVCAANLTGLAATECNAKKSQLIFASRAFDKSYQYLLPAGIASLNLTNRLLLRAGFYETYVRPQLGSLNGGRPVGFISQTVTANTSSTLTVNLSPLQLKPYTADNYDFALEWYNRKGSVVAFTYWHKNVKGFTRNVTDLAQVCPANGVLQSGISLGALALDPNFNNMCTKVGGDPNNLKTDGTPAPFFVNVVASENSPVPIVISGIEVNIQQNLGFLNVPIVQNFGAGFTFSRTNVSGKDQNGFPIVLGGVSKDNYNATLFYDSKLFGARVVYNYRNPYLIQPISASNITSSTAAKRGQLDLNVSVNPTPTLNISLDAFNVTNSLREQYEVADLPRTLRQSDYDGRTYTLSLRQRF